MRTFLLIFGLMWASLISAQAFQNGIILPQKAKEIRANDFFFPENVPLYEAAGVDEPWGELHTDEDAMQYLIENWDNQQTSSVPLDKMKMIGYEVYTFTYSARQKGYVEIMEKGQNYWVTEKDIERSGFRVATWMDFIQENSGKILGFYPKDPGLNLRTGPSTAYKKLVTMRGDEFEIIATGEVEGAWGKVEVTQYHIHPCMSDFPNEADNLVKKFTGWCKLLDDSGEPNVYFYPKGC